MDNVSCDSETMGTTSAACQSAAQPNVIAAAAAAATTTTSLPVTTITVAKPTAAAQQSGEQASPSPRLIQLKVPMASAAGAAAASPPATPPRPPTPHSSLVANIVVGGASTTTTVSTLAQSAPATSSAANIPRICNLGPLIYLQATGVKATANASGTTANSNTAPAPVQFTMPQVISETSKDPRIRGGSYPQTLMSSRRIIAGNPQIIHTNSSQSNPQTYAYLGTLIKSGGLKGKETTSQKVLLTPMPMGQNNKSPQIQASVLALPPTGEAQTSKAPVASLILQSPGGNVQGKMTGLILGNPNGGNTVTSNKTSLILPALPASPGGASTAGGKKPLAPNMNIPVPPQGKSNVPNIIRQSSSAASSTGKTFILPQGANSPGLIIPASATVGKPGSNQAVTGLLLPGNTSTASGLNTSTATSQQVTNLIITSPNTTSTTNLIISSTVEMSSASSAISSSPSTSNIIVSSSSVAAATSNAGGGGGVSGATANAAKMAGLFLPVSMEVQGAGKNSVTHHLTISNGKIQETVSGTSKQGLPTLQPVGGYGLPALQPISFKESVALMKSASRSLLKNNKTIDLTKSLDEATPGKDVKLTKKDETKEDDQIIVIEDNSEKDKAGEANLVEIEECSSTVSQEVVVKEEVDVKDTGGDVIDCDPNKENTLPNEDPKEDVKVEIDAVKTPPPEDFDPIKVLEWDSKGVGKLPGSELKFRLNDLGMIMLYDESDAKSDVEIVPSTPSDRKDEKKPHKEPIKVNVKPPQQAQTQKQGDEIYCCDGCGCYGLPTEFLDQKFCGVACRKIMSMKCAINRRRSEEKLRDLKLRKKRRKIKIMEIKRREANAAAIEGESRRREKEIDWLKEFVQLKAKREAAALGITSSEQPPAASEESKQQQQQSSSRASSNVVDTSPAASEADVSVSRSGTASPTFTDPDEHNEKKITWLSKSGEFQWNAYLAHHKAKAAHIKLFKDPFPYQKNGFRVGMKLEGIDPEHQSYICVLTVAEVKGFRLRLHFDGYPENHDFWTNADSPDIFQPGWCEKNSHHLHRPRGYTVDNFNWTMYLKQCKAQAAPRSLFSSRHASPVTPNQFRVGMKVEAVDRHNSQLVCVATVNDIIDSRLLIHFDSWGDMYDYWVDPTSPYIHPVGWCKENGHELTPPNNYKSASAFSWDSYLKETRSVAAPARAFKTRPPNGFRAGMKVEAVDKRAPHLLRVATVTDVRPHSIRVAFDNLPDLFGYWLDDDSPDIHPVGWAHKTGHPLEPPPPADDKLWDCGTVGCRGDGHTKGTKYTNHKTTAHCPYSPQALNSDSLLPDRFTVKHDLFDEVQENINSKPKRESRESSVTTDGTGGHKGSLCDGDSGDDVNGRRSVTSNEDESRNTRLKPLNFNNSDDKKRKKRKQEKLDENAKESDLKKLRVELIESVFRGSGTGNGYQASRVADGYQAIIHSAETLGLACTDDWPSDNPLDWTPKQVAAFVSNLHPVNSKLFVEQEIDGEALLLLSQSDLTSYLGLKLGPAIKVYNMITVLRQKVFD